MYQHLLSASCVPGTYFALYLHQITEYSQHDQVGISIIPTFQMGKLRLREFKTYIQGHKASNEEDSNLVLTPKLLLSTFP